MTQYNTLNVKLFNLQLNKVKIWNKKWNQNIFRFFIKFDWKF